MIIGKPSGTKSEIENLVRTNSYDVDDTKTELEITVRTNSYEEVYANLA